MKALRTGGARLADMIEEIAVLPEDAVASFFASRAGKKTTALAASAPLPVQSRTGRMCDLASS